MASDYTFLEDFGSDKSGFDELKLDSLLNRVHAMGILYEQKLKDSLKDAEADSSGDLGESIKALEVEVNGTVFTVDIQAKEYASYIDEGVDGWAQSMGSRFKFKTKGVDPKGKMVKSIKAYLKREGKMQQTKYAVLNKKRQPKRSMEDMKAMQTAYMIKRFGIKPNHFWRDATTEMEAVIAEEFGEAIKIDIINHFKR